MATLIDSDSPFLTPLDYSSLSSAEQSQVDALIIAADEFFKIELNRKLIKTTYTDEKLDGTGEPSIFVKNPPIVSLTDVDVVESSFSSDSTTTTYASTKFDIENNTGEISFKPGNFLSESRGNFTEGFQNIQVTYVGGYLVTNDFLKPIQMIMAQFVMEKFDPTLSLENLESERLGDYFYRTHKNYLDKVVANNKRILNRYRLRRV